MVDLKDFSSLVDLYYAKVFYHCVKIIKNNHDSADITQNTFTKAFINIKTLKKPDSFGAWIFTICNNEIKLFYRNRQKNIADSTDITKLTDKLYLNSVKKYDGLYSAIEILDEKYKNLIVLKYFAEFSVKEIATLTEISEKLVKSRLYDARKKLEKFLSDSADSGSLSIYNLNHERKKEVMSTLQLIELGSQVIPCMSVWGQRELLKCADNNEKFSSNVISELAKIEKGNEFTVECGGKLSYDELIKILACCDSDIIHRLNNSPAQKIKIDIGEYLETGGYVAYVDVVLYVPSIKDTVNWYKKYLNWDSDEHEDNGYAIIRIFNSKDSPFIMSTPGFSLRKSSGDEKPQNAAILAWIQGYTIEKVRERIINAGWDKVSNIHDSGFGAIRFIVEDLNGVSIEFLEWKHQ